MNDLGNDAEELSKERPFSRKAGRESMMRRASAVREVPKSFYAFNDSQSAMQQRPSSKHHLKDIANRIILIQNLSKRRNSSNNSNEIPYGNNFESKLNNIDEHGSPDHLYPKKPKKSCLCQSFLKCLHCIRGRKLALVVTIKVCLYFLLPMLLLSATLFYLAGNPIAFLEASYSWWILFFIRQCITFMLSQVGQYILVDVIILGTNLASLLFGKVVILIALQVKGWPTTCFLWALANKFLLSGDSQLAKHWLYFQGLFAIFTEANPSGSLTSNQWYISFLTVAIVCSLLAMVKRVIVAVFLGRKKYATYGKRMEQIMMKILLISEVSLLAEEIEEAAGSAGSSSKRFAGYTSTSGSGLLFSSIKSRYEEKGNGKSGASLDKTHSRGDTYRSYVSHGLGNSDSFKKGSKLKWKGSFEKKRTFSTTSESDLRAEIEQLLEWEEPLVKKKTYFSDHSIKTILQFTEALMWMDTEYPLSEPFGLADTQKSCLESSERLFNRLLMKSPESKCLKFDTVLLVAVDEDGLLDKAKAKALRKLFKPSKYGELTKLDFITSCHEIYKRVKTFKAKVENSSQLDDSFAQLFDIIFYFSLSLLALGLFGVDPFSVFISMTGILVPLAFLFNDAGSEYFQGLLLILARQPYDIGDSITITEISDTAEKRLESYGNQFWFVQGITLFTTTLRSALTNEVCTVSNGALASKKIINAARSPKAQVFIYFKLSLEVPFEKIRLLHSVLKEFVSDRPREWITLSAFRAMTFECEQGYVEYELVAQHVESWQMFGQVLQSRADLSSFFLEVLKQMDLDYMTPSVPVNITLERKNTVEVAEAILSAQEH